WLDVREQRLIIARDRAGKKPLYLRSTDDALTYASELKALLAMTGGRYRLNLDVAKAFLEQSLLGATPSSMLDGISSLPGGSYLTLDLRQERLSPVVREYWRPVSAKGTPDRNNEAVGGASEASQINLVRELFHDAVRLRLRSDVPVGLLLSGGIDSSPIASAVYSQKGA